MRVALVQMTSSDDPEDNLAALTDWIKDSVDAGAQFVLTPEVTNCLSTSRTRQREVLRTQDEDPMLKAMRSQAAAHGIWLLLGSIALKGEVDDRFVNRSILIAPDGAIAARYDKMHMFDVTLSETETYRESDGYRPGDTAALVPVGDLMLGMTICYDVRFAYLYRSLAQAGASVITVPSAFAPETGAAHWETLLRARAIETGAYVLAPAQCGTHPATAGRVRKTYGHSLAIDPWGRVMADGGTKPGITLVDLDPSEVNSARGRVPSLTHDRSYTEPNGRT